MASHQDNMIRSLALRGLGSVWHGDKGQEVVGDFTRPALLQGPLEFLSEVRVGGKYIFIQGVMLK
jgi:hypothetical protein